MPAVDATLLILPNHFFPNIRLPMPFEVSPEDVKNNEESTEGPMPLALPGCLLYLDKNGVSGDLAYLFLWIYLTIFSIFKIDS